MLATHIHKDEASFVREIDDRKRASMDDLAARQRRGPDAHAERRVINRIKGPVLAVFAAYLGRGNRDLDRRMLRSVSG
jgi:hypothetical protein